ncbi:MAG TPA: FAD-dependent oxidoreductase [Pirellulaceae bacterium]|jgi:glycerol-3-phosphate dehydrogenase
MTDKPIVILGGGINGAAAARELVLNGQSVWLVDTADLAFGATAYSSRLIHGGLRYLEFGEFSLVKESLDERARLLRLAPHLVRPLRLFIPVQNEWGGFLQAGLKFFNLLPKGTKPAHRGLRVVQMGLALYDWYSWGGGMPPRSQHRVDEANVPQINPAVGRNMWAYSDAQISYPERLVVNFLTDARRLAAEKGIDFRVLTYHRAVMEGKRVRLESVNSQQTPVEEIEPAAIINATGAWVDATLARLPAESRRLMGGTKGSHFLTFQPRLAELLRGQGVYTEARDGRPVFLLPFTNGGTLVGTTDIPFQGDPADVTATEDELSYLLSVVNDTFPTADVTRSDIVMHQCGVRPLPYVDAKTPAAITRRHQLVWNENCPLPLVSLVGGKLTTCRSLAEETAAAVLTRLDKKAIANSRERPIPQSAGDELIAAATHGQISPAAISSVINDEWVTTLDDLVERRLVLHFSPHLSRELIERLTDELIRANKIAPDEASAAIDRCVSRLQHHFGVGSVGRSL